MFKMQTASVDWQFSRSRRSLLVLLIKDLFGNGLVSNFRRMLRYKKNPTGETESAKYRMAAFRFVFSVTLFVAWCMTFGIDSFLLLWIVPIFTVLPFLLRVRSISEHFGIDDRFSEKTRNVHSSWFERQVLGFGPHLVNLHLTHHLLPGIPSFRLAQTHQLLKDHLTNYETQYVHRDGYFFGKQTVIGDLIAKK